MRKSNETLCKSLFKMTLLHWKPLFHLFKHTSTIICTITHPWNHNLKTMEYPGKASYYASTMCCMFLGLSLGNYTMAALTPNFYASTCRDVLSVVQSVVEQAVQNEARMAASLLRLHFHDCFVNVHPAFLFVHNY